MKLNLLALTLIALVVATSCKKGGGEVVDEHVTQSVLIYMASNNNLNSYAESNIDDLIENYSVGDMNSGKLIIYDRGKDEELPRLLEITNNQEVKVVKTYAECHNSADGDVLSEVIDDFKSIYEADSYGCIFWSHASAWLPGGFSGATKSFNEDLSQFLKVENDEALKTNKLYPLIRKIDYTGASTRAFGQDGSDWMELEELADAMDKDEFDFIIFDACYMSSIEVAYELRDKAKLLLSSPTEVLGEGLEYNSLVKDLYSDGSNFEKLKRVSLSYTNKYDEATSSIIDLTKVEAFAQEYKELMSTVEDRVGDASPYNVQRYDRYSNHVLFDLVDYFSKVNNDEATVARLEEMVGDIVLYNYYTNTFLGITLNNVSGISTYIPFDYYTIITPFYQSLRWYNDILGDF